MDSLGGEMTMWVQGWILNIAIAFDQLINAVCRGAPDETLSARAHRMRLKGHRYWGWTAEAINAYFFWQKDHCKGAYLAEVKRRQLPDAYTRSV